MTAPAAFTVRLPESLGDAEAAPMLCGGAIGWRALRLAKLVSGETLGLTGFGASAHLVLQFARARYPRSPIFVFARSEAEQQFARQLGAAWAGDTADEPPALLDAIIDTTPAWTPVVQALPRLAPGGRLIINAIRKIDADRSALATVDYATSLWMEREVKSVANVTRDDIAAALHFAATAGVRPTVTCLPLGDANTALAQLANGDAVHGATVLVTNSSPYGAKS